MRAAEIIARAVAAELRPPGYGEPAIQDIGGCWYVTWVRRWHDGREADSAIVFAPKWVEFYPGYRGKKVVLEYDHPRLLDDLHALLVGDAGPPEEDDPA